MTRAPPLPLPPPHSSQPVLTRSVHAGSRCSGGVCDDGCGAAGIFSSATSQLVLRAVGCCYRWQSSKAGSRTPAVCDVALRLPLRQRHSLVAGTER